VRRYLIIDAIEVDGQKVEAFAPVKLGRDGQPVRTPATRVDKLYGILRGQCIFFDLQANGCGIYAARPVECRKYICTNQAAENLSHIDIARTLRHHPAGLIHFPSSKTKTGTASLPSPSSYPDYILTAITAAASP
jgi:hypothetical protein